MFNAGSSRDVIFFCKIAWPNHYQLKFMTKLLDLNRSIDCRFSVEKRQYVYWSDDHIEYIGVPFMILGTKVLDCHHGKDRYIKLKELNKKTKIW